MYVHAFSLSHALFREHNDFLFHLSYMYEIHIVASITSSIYWKFHTQKCVHIYRTKSLPQFPTLTSWFNKRKNMPQKNEIFLLFYFRLQVDAHTHQIPITSTYVQEFIISQREIQHWIMVTIALNRTSTASKRSTMR